MPDIAWLFNRGEWTKIEHPLPAIHTVPPYTEEKVYQYQEQRKAQLEAGGYVRYPWLALGRGLGLTATVYMADENKEAAHGFYVRLDDEGRGFDIFATDLPSVLGLLHLVAPIGAWDIASAVEEEKEEARRAELEVEDG
jgi:hypothetical protein